MTQEQAEAHNRRIGRNWPAVSPRPRSSPSLATAGRSGRFNYELELFRQIRLAGLPTPCREYPFAKPERKFRADLAYPDLRLLIEIEGAPHRIKARYQSDIERRQWAFLHNWKILPVLPAQVRSGEAVELVRKALIS